MRRVIWSHLHAIDLPAVRWFASLGAAELRQGTSQQAAFNNASKDWFSGPRTTPAFASMSLRPRMGQHSEVGKYGVQFSRLMSSSTSSGDDENTPNQQGTPDSEKDTAPKEDFQSADSTPRQGSDPEVSGLSASEAREDDDLDFDPSDEESTEDLEMGSSVVESFNETLGVWAHVWAEYIKQEERNANKAASLAEVQRYESEAGAGQSDRVDSPPVDTRVWLHMYEAKGEDDEGTLENTFCPRTGDTQFIYDFNGFRDWRVEQNALLSDEAKCLMFKLNHESPDVWDTAEVARMFRIREERAIAIIKLKQREFEQADACIRALNRLQEIVGMSQHPTLQELHRPRDKHSVRHLTAWFGPWLQLYDVLPILIHGKDAAAAASTEEGKAESMAGDASEEGGEAAFEAAPANDADQSTAQGTDASGGEGRGSELSPAEKEASKKREELASLDLSEEELDEVVELHNFLAEAANREAKHIACTQDLWQCVYHYGSGEHYFPDIQTMPNFEELPMEEAGSFAESEYEHALRELGQRQDEANIDNFRLKLAWNMGEIGQSVQRAHRRRGQEGATLPKKPKDGWPILVTPLASGGRTEEPFVAMPDGTRRPLTTDEALYLNVFKKEPKMFSRPRKHAPFTNETLHAFQRKPNKSHDLYNPPYMGNPKKKRPTHGPERKDVRQAKLAAHLADTEVRQKVAKLQ